MNCKKLLTSVVAATMLLSLSGCYRDDKGVIEAASKYAEALISMDPDDIAELMDDGDGVEEMMAEYTGISGAEDIFEAVADSMTYEVDSKSVESSTKDKKASCDITFTLVDYEELYDDDYDIDEYIEAIEDDDGENVIEIEISVDFVYKKGKWLVADKKLKNIGKVYGFMEDISGYDLFGIRALSAEEFKDALVNAFGADPDDISDDEWADCREVYYWTDNCSVSFYEYKDPDGAYVDFDESLYLFDNADGVFCDYSETEGYLLINNSYLEYYYAEIYGGCYFKDETMVGVFVINGSDSDKAMVDEFLSELGYPLPYEQ